MSDDDDDASTSRGIGCVGGGCLVLLILAVVGGGVLYIKGEDLLRWGAARVVTAMLDTVIDDQLRLPGEEQAAVMRPIEDFANRVAAGEIEESVARRALTRVVESDAAAVVALRGFELRYAESEVIPPAEREAAALAVNRFANGLVDGRIDRSALAPLIEIAVVEETTEDGSVERRIKDPLPPEDVRAAVTHIEQVVAEADIDDPYREQDLEALVSEALERSVAEARAAADGSTPADDDAATDDDPGATEPSPETAPAEAL